MKKVLIEYTMTGFNGHTAKNEFTFKTPELAQSFLDEVKKQSRNQKNVTYTKMELVAA